MMLVRRCLPVVVLAALLSTSAWAGPEDVPPEIADMPGLPRVLVIGDSISNGYTTPLRADLKGQANVHHVPANAQTSTYALAHLEQWLGKDKWDLIVFNVGLHDVKMDKGKKQTTPEDYEKNLTALAQKLKATGAKVIFINTTPIPEGAARRVAGDEKALNETAAKVMKAQEVPVVDLCALARAHPDWQRKANVHFTEEGYKGLAAEVAAAVEKALKR